MSPVITQQLPTDGRPFDIIEAAQFLRVHPNTIRRRITDGTIRHVRIGKRIIIPNSEVRRLAGE